MLIKRVITQNFVDTPRHERLKGAIAIKAKFFLIDARRTAIYVLTTVQSTRAPINIFSFASASTQTLGVRSYSTCSL